jgi:hypothetical protein
MGFYLHVNSSGSLRFLIAGLLALAVAGLGCLGPGPNTEIPAQTRQPSRVMEQDRASGGAGAPQGVAPITSLHTPDVNPGLQSGGSASRPGPAPTPGGPAESLVSLLPRGRVFRPHQLVDPRGSDQDRQVWNSNPRLYLFETFDPSAETLLVVGMPGWGGRSEKFIWTLVNGLRGTGLARRTVVAAIQDTQNGGPRYQGQGDRAHANVWNPVRPSVRVMRHFVERMSAQLGHLRVTFVGFSTGGAAAPLMATRVASPRPDSFTVEGSVAMGTGSRVSAAALRETGQRVLFVVVPPITDDDARPLRDDQWNRISAEQSQRRLVAAGADAQLRHVTTARRHLDWHWGLISQCRYFPSQRVDAGRGYWPNYRLPNPETAAAVLAFLQGRVPPALPAELPLTECSS